MDVKYVLKQKKLGSVKLSQSHSLMMSKTILHKTRKYISTTTDTNTL